MLIKGKYIFTSKLRTVKYITVPVLVTIMNDSSRVTSLEIPVPVPYILKASYLFLKEEKPPRGLQGRSFLKHQTLKSWKVQKNGSYVEIYENIIET